MVPWQTLVAPETDSAFPPQITKPTRTPRRSSTPTSPSSPPLTARFSSLRRAPSLPHSCQLPSRAPSQNRWGHLLPHYTPVFPTPPHPASPTPQISEALTQPSQAQPKPREVETRVQCHNGSDEGPGCLTPRLIPAPPPAPVTLSTNTASPLTACPLLQSPIPFPKRWQRS